MADWTIYAWPGIPQQLCPATARASAPQEIAGQPIEQLHPEAARASAPQGIAG